jgi:hypothetical protein
MEQKRVNSHTQRSARLASTSYPLLPQLSSGRQSTEFARVTTNEAVSKQLKIIKTVTPLPGELPSEVIRQRTNIAHEKIQSDRIANRINGKSRDISHKLDPLKRMRDEGDMYKMELMELLGYQ